MAQIAVRVNAVPLPPGFGSLNPGQNVDARSGRVYAEKGDTISFVLWDPDNVIAPLTLPDPPVDAASAEHFAWTRSPDGSNVGIRLKDGVPVGAYPVTFLTEVLADTHAVTFTFTVVYSDVLITVEHGDVTCNMSGGKVESGEIVHALVGDTLCFRLVSTATTGDCTFDTPPLLWTSPDQCQGMAVTRVSGTEFTVVDHGRTGGRFDFKLDIDKYTISGRVHCMDDPSILNDNPP